MIIASCDCKSTHLDEMSVISSRYYSKFTQTEAKTPKISYHNLGFSGDGCHKCDVILKMCIIPTE